MTDQTTKRIMSIELLEKLFREYFELFSSRDLLFIWHGGEPLLAGLSFFEEAIDLQRHFAKKGQLIKNDIQTNATLIDDEWANFFRKYNFRVGVSLDGNRETHDRFRKESTGAGSFERTVRGIKILQEHSINPGVIQVVTRDTVSRSKENFQFLVKERGIKSIAVNSFLYLEGINKRMATETLNNRDFINYLKTYIELWLEADDPELRIREIENFLAGVLGKQAPTCTFNGLCTKFFCLNYDGTVYPCDAFSNREDLVLGDFSKQSLSEIFTSTKSRKYLEEVKKYPPECKTCEWLDACHNGCTYQRIAGISGKYYYCHTRKSIFKYMKKILQRYQLNELKSGENMKGEKAIGGAIQRLKHRPNNNSEDADHVTYAECVWGFGE
jgi:uncharacterized protein